MGETVKLDHKLTLTLSYDDKVAVKYDINVGDVGESLRENKVYCGLSAVDELPYIFESEISRRLVRDPEGEFHLDSLKPKGLYAMCHALVRKIKEAVDASSK